MNQNRSKELLEALLSSVSTNDVRDILDRQDFTAADWKPYGGREQNWDIVSNQQTIGVGALTELITNSIDAVLSRKAYEYGILDLSSDDAPQSMQDAVRKFYGINEGKLSSWETQQLTELAKKSILIGVKRKNKGSRYPTITVVDFGEGQNPEDFPATFLSLSKANKEGIRFVQGKFNMGSTGSICFCTESDIAKGHYKLIASKKYDGGRWGWTLIRVPEVEEGRKLPIVEYLVPDGKIPSFNGDSIKAFGDDDIGEINQGSLVRLFDYDIGSGAHAVDFGLYQALTLNLLECALPIRIFDFDAKPTTGKGDLRAKGIADRTFSGMGVMLNADFVKISQQDPDIPEKKPEKRTTEFVHLVSDLSHAELGEIKILATGLSELPEFMKNSKERIFYTINGQTHATENASFLNSSKIKLGDLQSHLIVNVQCERMDKTALTTIFMGNREKKRDSRLSRELKSEIQKKLSNDAKLKEYQSIIRRRRVAQIIEEDEETKKMLSDLIVQDPAIKELLGLGSVATDVIKVPGGPEKWTEGKQFPTFLKPLNAKMEGDTFVKQLPLRTNRKIKCGTDAENDYLSRTHSPGWIFCTLPSKQAPRSASLRNGIATFTFNPPSTAEIGDKITLEIGFDDDGPRGAPLVFPLTLEITKPEKPQHKKPGKPTGITDKIKPAVADPTEWVQREDWDEFGFNERSGATVMESEDGIKIHVNYAHERLAEMRGKETDEAITQLNESRFRICLGFLTLAVYRHHKKKAEENTSNEEDASDAAKESSDAIAAYILPLIKTLGGAEQV